MKKLNFELLATHAIADIPHRFLDEMHNLAVVVESAPSRAFLKETNTEPHGTLQGFYQGTTLSDREWAHGNSNHYLSGANRSGQQRRRRHRPHG